MKISQILNNNVALVKKGSNEIIVYSKGLSFRKKVGQPITNEEIEKIYVLDSHDTLEHFSYLLANTDERCIVLVNELIAYGEQLLNQKANDYLSLTLLDHISLSLKRAEKGQFIRSPLTWEVKRFYPQYFNIGRHGLSLIKDTYRIEFPEDEAVSIALHFVNLQELSNQNDHAVEAMEVLKDIVSIIQFHYGMQLDDTTFQYMRFMTHLQYFIQRVVSRHALDEHDAALHKQISSLYKDAYGCVQKIKVYLTGRYQYEITIDEETYLMLHIKQVTSKNRRS